MKTKAMIVDGHASVREMLSDLMTREAGYEMVGEAATGFEALKLFRAMRPTVVVLELLLPEMNGLELIRELYAEAHEARVLVYSGVPNGELLIDTLRERPHGFVHKRDSLAMLMEALRAVASGCSYFSPFATDALNGARGRKSSGPVLSTRERTVLQMLAEGMSNKQMAQRLSVSPKTVEYHRARLMHKLDLHDVAMLTRYAARVGLVAVDA